MKREPTDFEKFDTVVRKVISISHDELKRREAKWKKEQSRKRKGKKAAIQQEQN